MASKRADNAVSIDTSVTTLYDPASSSGCTGFGVVNRSTSSAALLVNVAGLHDAGEYVGLAAGVGFNFLNRNGIGKVTVKAATGSVTIDFGVTAA